MGLHFVENETVEGKGKKTQPVLVRNKMLAKSRG